MSTLALGLLALSPACAQTPLTGDLVLWSDASDPVWAAPTTVCDDAGICAAFWAISENPQNTQLALMGAVVSPTGSPAPTLLTTFPSGAWIGQPIAVGMQEGFAVFYSEGLTPAGEQVMQLLGADLSPAGPPILLPLGASSVVRTADGFALLGTSARPHEGPSASLAFIDTDGRVLRAPVQLSLPAANFWGLGLAVQPGGSLVAVYSSQPLARSNCAQVFVRRIGSSGRLRGRLLGPAVAVGDKSCNQDFPAVGVATDGTFLVAWSSGTVTSTAAIVAERFSAQGRPIGRLFRVSQSAPNAFLPVVAVDPNSHYFVVWESNDPTDAFHDIRGRWLEADGTPITPELTLNEAQDELDHLNQGTPQVAMPIGSLALVTWQSIVPGNINPPTSSVARWFTTPP